MEFTAVACNLLTKKTDCLVITLGNQVTDNAPAKSSALEAIDNAISGLISRLLKSGDLKQEPNSSVLINEPQGLSADRLLILGTGSKPLNEQSFVALAKNIAGQLTKLPIKTACISLAGLEVDLNDFFRRSREGSLFGILTFLIPFVPGFIIFYFIYNYRLETDMLNATMLEYHTLVSNPILGRFFIINHRLVNITIACKIIADTAVLIILGVISD